MSIVSLGIDVSVTGMLMNSACRISPRQSPKPVPSPSATLAVTLPPPTPPQDVELELTTSDTSVEATLAARRAKRLAIMAKYAGISSATASQAASPSPGPSSAVEPPPAVSSVSDNVSQPHSAVEIPTTLVAELKIQNGNASELFRNSIFRGHLLIFPLLGKRESVSTSPTPAGFSLAKESELEADAKTQEQGGDRDQISAADYDPSLDRREDEQRRVRVGVDEPKADLVIIEEEVEEDEDVDDMFAVATTAKKVRKVTKVVVSS